MGVNLVFYCPYAFGGTWDYALHLSKSFSKMPGVTYTLLTAANAKLNAPYCAKKLTADSLPGRPSWQQKLHFIMRSVVNPLRLCWFLATSVRGTRVVMNDFEQLTAPLWFWMLWLVARLNGVTIGVVLHDPDRDAYFPFRWLSAVTARMILAPARVGYYHELLPNRSYYRNSKVRFVNVPHGLYPSHKPDLAMKNSLMEARRPGLVYFAMIGNIRLEKNYPLAIEALSRVPGGGLIIAGRAANSSVNVDALRQLAVKYGVADRVIWHTRFLSDNELASVLTVANCVLLSYGSSFVSQSGVLFLTAAYQKPLIVSETKSALAALVGRFGLGALIEPDSLEALVAAMRDFVERPGGDINNWRLFNTYSSWDACAGIMLDRLKGSN